MWPLWRRAPASFKCSTFYKVLVAFGLTVLLAAAVAALLLDIAYALRTMLT